MADFDDFGLLAQMARRELIHLLESMPEMKDLAVEPSLMRPLDKIASMSVLQEHNCAHVQQFLYHSSLIWSEHSLRRVYIIRPTLAAAKCIADHILAEPERNYSVIFVPQRLYICEQEFERRGVFGMIDVLELDLPLISIDSHLFSLEHHEFTAATLVDHTFIHLRAVAKSLWQLQTLYGLIPIVYGVGEISAHVNKLMKKLHTELGEPRSSPDQPIGHLFLLDRSLDLTTVFLTGLTYESMVHDTFGISCGKVVFGEEVNKRMKGCTMNRGRITTLDNNDPIFSAVRNMHMTAVFPFLSAKAKSIQASYDKGSSLEQVKDMKEFVSNELRALKQQHKLLELHICACEAVLDKCKGISDRLSLEHALVSGNFDPSEVMAYLEDCMCAQHDQWQILMLACLWSVTQNGIPTKYFAQFRTQYLHAFGHENLAAFHFLGLQGLLIEHCTSQIPSVHNVTPKKSSAMSSSFSKPTFQFLARRMALLPGDIEPALDLRNPNQMRYVFSGVYTPVLCKIVGDTVNNGWNMQEMKTTFGDSVFCDQNSYTRASRPPDSRIRKAILVYFIGGVTYSEVAALTLLAQYNNLRIIIATTNIIHREKFMKEIANVAVTLF
uniref:Vacuolar protein sorting-associated protein 33B n=1 Tax=Setaria digitata TaxID=48799 RepID=A0A915PRY8_9BILA